MASMIDVKLASDRTMKAIVSAAFPNYRRRTAWLSTFHSGMNINSYWDGGSRDEYAIVRLSDMARLPMPSVGHPFYEVNARGIGAGSDEYVTVDRVGNVCLKALPAGYAIVRAGTFCGKPATAHVHVNAEDLAKLLPAGSVEAR